MVKYLKIVSVPIFQLDYIVNYIWTLQGRRKGNFQGGAEPILIFLSNIAPNKSISDFYRGAPGYQGGRQTPAPPPFLRLWIQVIPTFSLSSGRRYLQNMLGRYLQNILDRLNSYKNEPI